MRVLQFILTILLLTVGAFAQAPQVTLKQKEPHWRPVILEHYPSGLPKRVIFYAPIDEEREAPVKQLFYDPSGGLKSEMDVTLVAEDSEGFRQWKDKVVPHGAAVIHFAQGQIEKIAHYDHGVLNGEVRVFYPNGNLRGHANYKQGLRQGYAATYHEDGKKAEEINYEGDKMVGDLIRYYPNQERALQVPYENGSDPRHFDGMVSERIIEIDASVCKRGFALGGRKSCGDCLR
jgi:hypothetical protein